MLLSIYAQSWQPRFWILMEYPLVEKRTRKAGPQEARRLVERLEIQAVEHWLLLIRIGDGRETQKMFEWYCCHFVLKLGGRYLEICFLYIPQITHALFPLNCFSLMWNNFAEAKSMSKYEGYFQIGKWSLLPTKSTTNTLNHLYMQSNPKGYVLIKVLKFSSSSTSSTTIPYFKNRRLSWTTVCSIN